MKLLKKLFQLVVQRRAESVMRESREVVSKSETMVERHSAILDGESLWFLEKSMKTLSCQCEEGIDVKREDQT